MERGDDGDMVASPQAEGTDGGILLSCLGGIRVGAWSSLVLHFESNGFRSNDRVKVMPFSHLAPFNVGDLYCAEIDCALFWRHI